MPVPNSVVDVHEHRRLRRRAGDLEHFLLAVELVAEQHLHRREVADHELVALLGDFGGAGDIDDERNALLLGDLGDRRGLAGIEGADQKLGAVVDQLFGVLAGGVDVRTRCRH